jgi:hypothetical protein
MSVPPSPVARQHEVWLVLHIVLPHGTMPGSHAAPPSGAWQVTVVVPPLLVPPSPPELVPPSEVTPLLPPSPLVGAPLLLPPLPLPEEGEPPLLPLPPLLLDPPELLPEPGCPPSVIGWTSDELQCVSDSGTEADSSVTATAPKCIFFIAAPPRASTRARGDRNDPVGSP